MSLEKLRKTLEEVVERLPIRVKVDDIVSRLLEAHSRSPRGPLHSVIQLIVAAHLRSMGYKVEVEHRIPPDLTCDVYAEKESTMIVEVETGYTPPHSATRPRQYLMARILHKVLRYSQYADKIAIAVPEHYNPPIPPQLLEPPHKRSPQQLVQLASLLPAKKATHLPLLQQAKIDYIIIVNVDECTLKISPPHKPKPLTLKIPH